jgi:hypothetical protein
MGLRDAITKDAGWKLFSLVLAVFIWVTIKTVSDEPFQGGNPLTRSEHTFTRLPVLVVSAAADVREFKVDPAFVGVTVRGQSDVVRALTDKDIRVTVDLTDIEAARGLRKRVNVATPPGVTFIGASPSEVDVVVPSKP